MAILSRQRWSRRSSSRVNIARASVEDGNTFRGNQKSPQLQRGGLCLFRIDQHTRRAPDGVAQLYSSLSRLLLATQSKPQKQQPATSTCAASGSISAIPH